VSYTTLPYSSYASFASRSSSVSSYEIYWHSQTTMSQHLPIMYRVEECTVVHFHCAPTANSSVNDTLCILARHLVHVTALGTRVLCAGSVTLDPHRTFWYLSTGLHQWIFVTLSPIRFSPFSTWVHRTHTHMVRLLYPGHPFASCDTVHILDNDGGHKSDTWRRLGMVVHMVHLLWMHPQ